MTTIELVREVACRAPPDVIWRAISDTDRLNRVAGMAPVAFQPADAANGARVSVRTRLDGFPVTFEEEPFEWHTPQSFLVRRHMKEGVLDRLTLSAEVLPGENGGSRVRWRLDLDVKYGLLTPVARLLGQLRMNTLAAATHAFDEEISRPVEEETLSPPDDAQVQRALRAMETTLPPAAHPVARRLAGFVARAPDKEVVRIRPFELADRWNVDRAVLLDVCLEGVVAGLVQMYWDLVCPSCRGGASRVEHLFDLPPGGHCGFCDISFDLPLDRAVEALFQPAPAVRNVVFKPYCTGGPAAMPHVLAQTMLPRGGHAALTAPAEPGTYRLFVRGGDAAALLVDAQGLPEAELVADGGLTPATVHARPGAALVVRQPFGATRHVKIERAAWSDRAATAHRLALAPRFRRIFSNEVLGPGRQLQVARVALLFSDLSGSTALYSRVGDATAFRIVQDHFEHLRAAVDAEGGVVVKTIGDAVMAAFPEEGAALRAGIRMLATWADFQAGRPDSDATLLKVGVYAGPAYVVTANGALDYFGQTVNIAARLQGAAHEREIVVSDELAARGAEAGWLGAARVTERFDAVLKGLDRPLRAARISV